MTFLVRMKIWSNKAHAEKNKVKNLGNLNLKQNFQVFMEEWLTDYRAKLMKKCQTLLKVAGPGGSKVKTQFQCLSFIYRKIPLARVR